MTKTTLQSPFVSLKDHLMMMLFLGTALALRSWVTTPPHETQVAVETGPPASTISSSLEGDE
jgi:hypothetical protein